ncbi:uncharacterized protein LOC121382960 isoform X2 [Gigantopelta aegis]|nr:uncharacterized protein LOC121382960 isoform X2 [Gigantopelta aegis]
MKLRTELEETRSTLRQLVTESSHENFDERRVNLLKCQIIQLERQMLLLSDAIGSRTESLMEVENVLCWLADNFRLYITAEVKGPCVPVERRELTRMVESTESARIKLFKNIENCSKQTLSRPLMFMNKFILPGREEEVTLLNIASGKLDHVNLKHVAQLESKLSLLYKELIRIHALMVETESANHKLFSCHVTTVVRERLKTQILKSCAMMKGCADDLMALSLLYPSAPWRVLKKPVVEDVSCEQFMSCLPTLPRSKTQEVHLCIQALLKSCNYRQHMMDKQIKTLKNEIKFHQKVYSHQVQYMEILFDSLRDNYCSFEKSLQDVFIQPMRNILDAFNNLEESASENTLKIFLSTFKENKQQFIDAIEKFKKLDENEEGKDTSALSNENAISSFGDEYFKSLETIVQKQQRKRDRATREDEDLRVEQRRLDDELRTLLRDMELEQSDPRQTNSVADNSEVQNDHVVSDKKESRHSISENSDDKTVGVASDKKESRHIISENCDSKNVRGVSDEKESCIANSSSVKNLVSDRKGNHENTSKMSKSKPSVTNLNVDRGYEELTKDKNNTAQLSSVKGRNSFAMLPSKFLVSAEKTKSTDGRQSQQLSYKPNLQLAKEILQLKRSGSLSQLYTRRASSSNEIADFRLQSDSMDQLDFDDTPSSMKEIKGKRTLRTLQKPPFK